eukprot:jgi/Mesvir1/24767/Mv26011-RA.1
MYKCIQQHPRGKGRLRGLLSPRTEEPAPNGTNNDNLMVYWSMRLRSVNSSLGPQQNQRLVAPTPPPT